MIDKRLRFLLSLLAGSIAIAACAVTLSYGFGRLSEAAASVDRYTARIERLRQTSMEASDPQESIESMQKGIADLSARFYKPKK